MRACPEWTDLDTDFRLKPNAEAAETAHSNIPGGAERIGIRCPLCPIVFRRLTLRSATGTPQRGGPCYELCQAKSVRDLFFL